MHHKHHGILIHHPSGRTLLRIMIAALLVVLFPLAAGVGTAAYKVRRIVAHKPAALTVSLPPLPTPDSNKRTAVVLMSNNKTEVTDSLPPFELLAASGAFNTYFVAPERRVATIATAQYLPFGIGALPSGLDILPHYGFADYERVIGRAPDLIVIPFLTEFTPGSEGPILDWIRTHAGPDTTILAICAGSRVLVETGLLDGRAATSVHTDLSSFPQRYPAVRWQSRVRWVEDGPFITSGTLTAGIDATLHTIDRLAGRAAAEQAGNALGYPHLDRLDDPTADYQPRGRPDLGLLPNVLFGWQQTTVGVLLHEGMSETALAALLDSSSLNLLHSSTLAPQRTWVHSRHGMIMAPRFSYATAPQQDRVIMLDNPVDSSAAAVAEQWNQQPEQRTAEFLTSGPGAAFAYDAVISDFAQQYGGAVARSVSVNLVYPVDPESVRGFVWTPSFVVHALGIGLLGLALSALLLRRQAQPQIIATFSGT